MKKTLAELIAKKVFNKKFWDKLKFFKREREEKSAYEKIHEKTRRANRLARQKRDADAVKKEQARIKSGAPPKDWIEAAKDKEYLKRKAYDKEHGSTSDRINRGLEELKDYEKKSKHFRN